ncbi:ABC transporter substrate-binding protein [Streptomyces microflavus]|uniref:ABC transporter substrate-binding protein n=1 Tax=Streptomyces microflavus TaxID=1919 RepID=UPI00369ADF38
MTASIMRRKTAKSRIAAVGAIAVAGTLLLTACGDQTESASSEGGDATATKAGAPLFSKLPEKYQKSGVIKVGTNAEYAPMESVENGKIVGVDPDIAEALGKQLGVKFEFTSGSFDGLITALYSRRHDVIMSSITDTKERQEGLENGKKLGKGVDFVDYFLAGTAVYTKKGNPQNIKSIEDLCGKTAAVQRGTTYEEALKKQSKACTDGGKKAVKIESFENDTEAQTRVKSGGAVAGVNDYPVALDLARKADNGKAFEVVGEQIDAGPFGMGVNKDNTGLRDALKEAVDAIIADGSYQKALDKWGAGTGAIDKAAINGGK